MTISSPLPAPLARPTTSTITCHFGAVPLRVIDKGGELWFIARDVCDCLSIANHRHAIARLDADEKGVAINDTLGGHQEMATISEAGMYTLALRSRKPSAAPFRRWITHEVLPSIRRAGMYALPGIPLLTTEVPGDPLQLATMSRLLRDLADVQADHQNRHLLRDISTNLYLADRLLLQTPEQLEQLLYHSPALAEERRYIEAARCMKGSAAQLRKTIRHMITYSPTTRDRPRVGRLSKLRTLDPDKDCVFVPLDQFHDIYIDAFPDYPVGEQLAIETMLKLIKQIPEFDKQSEYYRTEDGEEKEGYFWNSHTFHHGVKRDRIA